MINKLYSRLSQLLDEGEIFTLIDRREDNYEIEVLHVIRKVRVYYNPNLKTFTIHYGDNGCGISGIKETIEFIFSYLKIKGKDVTMTNNKELRKVKKFEKVMGIAKVRLEAHSSASIDEAVSSALCFADEYDCIVSFTFNTILMVCDSDSTKDEMMKHYNLVKVGF